MNTLFLIQLVSVFLLHDWETYCDDAQRKEKYPHLRPQIALQWLEKCVEKAGFG